MVRAHLNAAGFATVAVDLPGHGLNAVLPRSFLSRPLNATAFATEPSALAGIPAEAYADTVIAAAEQAHAMGAERVFAVGHSMGGVPISFAAARSAHLFAGLVYLAALAPTPGKPAGAYLQLEDQRKKALTRSALCADPAQVGALRVDPRSTDPEYLAKFKAALAADVDQALLQTILHFLTPDAPTAIYGEVATFPSGFGDIARTYIRCTEDRAVLSSTSEAIVADFDAAWPDNPTSTADLNTSHAAMFANPQALAELLIAAT